MILASVPVRSYFSVLESSQKSWCVPGSSSLSIIEFQFLSSYSIYLQNNFVQFLSFQFITFGIYNYLVWKGSPKAIFSQIYLSRTIFVLDYGPANLFFLRHSPINLNRFLLLLFCVLPIYELPYILNRRIGLKTTVHTYQKI